MDEFEEKERKRVLDLVHRFEEMLVKGNQYYFETEHLEDIIDFYFEKNAPKKGLLVVDFALKQYPFATVFLLRKAQLLAANNQSQKALEVLSYVESVEPLNPEMFMTKGSIYSLMSLSDQAIENFKKAAEYSDDVEDIYLTIAMEYMNSNRAGDAIYYYKKVLAEHPDNEIAIYELAFCFDLNDQLEECVRYYTAFVEEQPYSASAWFNLGVTYNRLEKYEDAIKAYDYAILIHEEYSSAYFNKANSLAALNRLDEAIEVYKETMKHEEPDALTHYYMGECYEKKHDYETALKQYFKSIAIDSKYPDTQAGIAVVLDALGRPSEAVHYIKKAIELEKENPEYWHILGQIQKKLLFYEDAELAFKKSIELDSDDSQLWLDYADLLFEQENKNGSLEILAEGIKNHPQNAALQYRISACLMSIGQKQEALSFLHTALKLDYDKHSELFAYIPQLKENTSITDLIESYKK
ncbi:MAG: tetratricopeptide repeat protein [Bacteroidota bacterium]